MTHLPRPLTNTCNRAVAAPSIVAAVATATALTALAFAACYPSQGSQCSAFYPQPNDGCPDTFEHNSTLERLAWDDVPGREGLEDASCWVYVQDRYMGPSGCENYGQPQIFTYGYLKPVGNTCDGAGGGT